MLLINDDKKKKFNLMMIKQKKFNLMMIINNDNFHDITKKKKSNQIIKCIDGKKKKLMELLRKK